jgi:amino acid adenylation domain-containing protein
MATIWQELLVIEKVGIHDNFFEIGGHSLLGTRLISAIRKKLKVEITIKDLFMHPTINTLSSFIDTNELGNVIPAIIAVHPRPPHIPLSFSQERMWFIDQLEGSVQYNSPTILRLKGNLNLQSLERAIQEIVNRHEALRTVFVEEEGKVFQIINNADNWHLMQIDGSLFKENKQALKKYIETSALQPFNLSKDYMVRAELITLDISEFVLIVTMHHIASDAWSLSIVVSEVIELYNSFVENREAKLPSLPLQYADYSIWQRNYLQGVVLDRKIDYWINILQNPSPLNLPTDYPRPSIRGIAGAVETFKLNKDLSDKVNLLSHRQETTLFMTLLAAFKVLLSKYSNQDDISVGTSIANRPQVELENLIGYFVNTLTLRTQLDYKQLFTELLQKVKITTLGAYQHQDVPFEKLVEAVVKERDPSHSPLFQVMLVLVNTPDTGKLKLGDVELKGEGHKSKISKFDLTFHFNETPGGLQLSVEYSTDLFRSSTIHRMVDHFITLLTSITENPEQKLQDISIASTPEQALLLTDFGQHTLTYPQDKNITELFELQATQTPDQTALTFENKKLTYQELNQQANQLAHALMEQGVKPETLVPIYLNKGHGMIIAILGVLKAGGAYVPIDSEFPLSRVDYMLKDSGAKLLLSERALSKNLDSSIHKFNLDELDLNLQPTSNPQTKAKANSLAYVIYTSGSTGQPKGVMIEHGNLTDYVFGLKANTPIDQCRNHALVSTIATDLGNTVIYGSLLSGGNLHVFSKETTSDPEALANYFKQHQIDCLKIVPSHYKALSQQQPLLPQKLLIFGGEALKSEDVKAIQQADSNLTIVNHYGPTETTIGKLLHTIESKRVYGKTIPIGKPFSNTKVYVLDAQQHLSPIGVPGQLYIAGDGLARGYLNNEALTNEKFTINPYNQTRMYATGDLVKYLEDGNLEYLGRIDQQVKIRGYRIELSEIERALNQIPTINQSVVIAKEDKQGNKQLLAYVVGNKEFDKPQTIQVLKQSLPDYMIPASITQIDEIPLTLNGKIDYKALPDPEQPGQGGYSAPQDETEQRLAEIWQEILEVDQVGRNDDFFELGGHSLLAIRLISAVRKAFETEMPIGDIFDYPTIAQLKTRLNKSHAVLPAITQQPKAGPIPLSFSQERLWFIDKLEGSRQYHIPSVLRLKGELNIEALQNSIQQIVNRHEILRTTIQEVDGQGYQYIKAKDLWKLEQKLNVTQEQLPELVKQLIDKPFDLNADDMLRASLLELETTDHVLVVTLHHIASDGWSTSILVKELVKLYESYIHKQNPNLAALPVQYADYAIWQRTYLQGELLETKLDYWKDKLQGAAPLDLPTDYPRPALQSNKGAVSGFKTDKPLSDKLNELSKAKGTTLFMTLLSAFKVLLYRYSNQSDITIGTPMAGRQQQELEGLIGFFINTLALRDELNPEHSFDQLLQQVKTTTLEAYQHQDVPFEKVVEAVTQNRDLSRSPVFQVMFVFQNTPDIPQLQLGEVRLSRNAVEHVTAQFDLTLNIAENPTGLQISMEYCTDLFSKDTITRFQKHFERILLEISNDSTQKIGEISILTDEEENQILNEFNSQIVLENNNQTILDLFQLQCQKTPDKVAVTFNNSELTYQELDQKSNCLANYLLNKGVKPNMLVPVCLKRSPEMLVSILAILKTGAAYVPIDSTYPESRINFMLEDTKAQFIISESSLNNSTKTGVNPITKILIDSDWSEIQKHSKNISLENCESENLAYIIYTSGSTGQPKGVMVTHQNLLESTKTRNAFYSYVGSVFLVPSFAFDSSVAVLFWSLTSGGKLILCGDDDLKDPKIVETILQETETILCVPSYYKSLCDQNLLRQSQLSKVILAGEKLSDDLVSSHFSNLPLAKLYNEYGPTENTVWATVESCAENQKVSIGKPIPGTKLYITGELGHLLPVGVPGEIWLGGSQVAKGYLNQEELTQQKFVKDLFDAASDARVYKTGDIGRWLPDGRVEYLGRQDDQVKVRGYRIETGEIELNLLQSSMVNQVIVVCSKDNLGENRLIAYIQPKSNYDKNVLIQFLKSKLPDYMNPMVWIEIETVPLTPNGKVDRSALPLPLDKQVRINEFLSPRNITEFKLVQIWSELLNVEAIGVTDNFFELGGHSLLVMRLASLVNKQFDVDLKIVDVFNNSTVEKLALFIEMQKGIKRLPSVTIEQRPIKVPLSYSQERLWFIHQLEGSIQYHIPSVIKLTGLLNVKALQQAFEKIIERHEILRTVILEENGIAFQKILNPISWKLNIIQLEDSNFELDSIIQQQIYKPFDLSKDFMLRSNLMQIKQDENLLVITMHHIASDGWSVGVLIQEMLELYQSFVDGREPQLPKLEIQYSDFSIWQRRHLTPEYLENQLSYWRTKLEGSIPISLPIDFKRPAVQSKNGDLVSIKIEYDVSKKLSILSKQNGATLFMTLLAAFKILLSKHSNQEDIIVGTPVSGRVQKELEPLIGFFINTLVLRTQVNQNSTFDELLQDLKNTVLEAFSNQETPFEKVVEAVVSERDRSRSPLFQVMFVFQNKSDIPDIKLEQLSLHGVQQEHKTTQFELRCHILETSTGFQISMEYCTDLFSKQSIERLNKHFAKLLKSIVEKPEAKLSELELLEESETHQLLFQFNATQTQYPEDKTILDLFAQHVNKSPNSTSVVYENQSLSFQELDEKSNQLANYLIELGVKPDSLVAICMERSLEMMVGILGILKANAAYVPIDPDYPQQRIEYMLDDCKASIILSHSEVKISLPNNVINLDTDWKHINQQAKTKPASAPKPNHLAYVIYTSGSTGHPKGVMNEHSGLLNRLCWAQDYFKLTPKDKVLQKTTYSFDVSVWELLWPLISGAQLVFAKPGGHKDNVYLKEVIEKEQITMLHFVPSMLEVFLSDLPKEACPSLKQVLCSGEALKPSQVQLFGQKLPQSKLFNLYGPTEAAIDVTCWEVEPNTETVPIGKPVANTQIYILNQQNQPVPIGVAGEIHIGGVQVARGYLNKAELTSEKFIPNPYSKTKTERLYKTGDLGKWTEDGTIEYLGRLDDQVKIRGYRIELGEIETAIEQIKEIKQSAVLAKDDAQGNKRLVAYVVARKAFDKSKAMAELQQKLPEYMVPQIWVELKELPLTPNGKTDRKALPEPDIEGQIQGQYVAPRNETEQKLAEIWKEILKLEKIGIHDNFFEIGGHSLMALRIISGIRQKFDFELEIVELVNEPTIAGISKIIIERKIR